jgi:hypothetical protein
VGYVTLLIALVFSGLAWRRILWKQDRWPVKLGYFVLAAIPVAGPIFYLMIDPPESAPPAVAQENFWKSIRAGGSGQVWPSFTPLIEAFAHFFRRFK